MQRAYSLWTYAWSHAGAAAQELKPGDEIDTWNGPALVQDKTGEEILLRLDGSPHKFSLRLRDMDVRLAAGLIEHRAASTGLGLDAHLAALYVFDREASHEDAWDACLAAVQRGVHVDPLVAELKLREAKEAAAGRE
jgi:hypothetical protein